MQKLKDFIVKNVSKTLLAYIILVFRYKRKYKSLFKTGIFAIKAAFKFYAPSKKLLKGIQVRKIFNKAKIEISETDKFVYNIDIFKTIHRDNRIIDNITIDYSKILNNSLNDFYEINSKLKDSKYKESQKEVLNGITEYIDRECNAIRKSNRNDKDKIIKYLNNIKDKNAVSFEEAIQRILFFNQLLWQTGHGLNGLGRLDKILETSYNYDKENNNLTKEEAKEMLKDMVKILHQKFWFKSNVLMGDTGQIIILGGKEPDGSYFYNELTYMFIEVMEEVQLPDPKVFLRITEKVPRDLMELSLRCIKTGIGCPLFSNDDVIIPKLIEFGYDEKYTRRVLYYLHPEDIEEALDYMAIRNGIIQHRFVHNNREILSDICYICGEKKEIHLKGLSININQEQKNISEINKFFRNHTKNINQHLMEKIRVIL